MLDRREWSFARTNRVVLPLRKPDNQGRLIFIIRGNLHDPRKHKIPDLAKICILVLETMMKYYPAGSIYGYSVFVDTNNLFIRQILQFTPFVLRNMVHTFQKCYPMRYHKIVVFNTPKAFEVIIEIMKTFMSEKLKNRFHVYSHKHCFEDIPAHILPVEYGGTDGTLEELTVHWKKLIEKNRDWITKMTE
ncbi:alpha-tocopherol transfer protein-like isoform X2 [Solenopsis invicta]|uniref:alpha-tocopherol transfer protein-like isoform X2 n=1 Tax=Solenopsis invicta TaxID=13686 RepID=UPI0005959AB8|nr:alpha-tocopherol transfer protein-like isoform X2 [Solenopsis invicta]